ncbi:hypothetical protein IV203_035856 [Nitzschia inconspicua]|uniref:Uncharacterized protein n=1 Tax=Nitzschia inconspicua TaxID=303405 RepID=A0A9K3LEQ1_9STRA|nr:hypothetical protein IV203_035856 [Nitzschia inconspicua]
MKFANSIAAAVTLAAGSTTAFVFPMNQFIDTSLKVMQTTSALRLTPQDLTDMMAKAHEEKIRALKDIEDKKNAEIQALKSEVESLKQSSLAPASTAPAIVPSKNFSLDITNMSKEQLAGRLVTYQQFMSKYIVEAQEQKIKAVKAAEAAITAKYEQKLKLYQAKTPPTSAPSTTATKLYEGRSANVAAAAAAGKSRWGDMEVSKAQGNDYVNGVQVVNGATAPSEKDEGGPLPITILSGNSLYYHRNQMVAKAGAAGKSRWGDAEVEKATKEAAKVPSLASFSSVSASASSPDSAPSTTTPTAPKVVITPEIEAADHGLRSDGGVGGPSLAERVNLGERLFASNGDTNAPALNGSISPSLYDSRNARVAAAAAAGKSRWGTMENLKATNLSSNALSGAAASAVAVAVPPAVEAADHGMRADGGVGGPTLAQRVNLGADLLKP